MHRREKIDINLKYLILFFIILINVRSFGQDNKSDRKQIIKGTDPNHETVIFFDKNKSDHTSADTLVVRELFAYLKNNKDTIQISGHCDHDEAQNKDGFIDEIRAKNVYALLLLFGIEANRLMYKGYRDLRPMNPDDNEELKKYNRRVDFLKRSFGK
jgi:flagellar motor protein MotB